MWLNAFSLHDGIKHGVIVDIYSSQTEGLVIVYNPPFYEPINLYIDTMYYGLLSTFAALLSMDKIVPALSWESFWDNTIPETAVG